MFNVAGAGAVAEYDLAKKVDIISATAFSHLKTVVVSQSARVEVEIESREEERMEMEMEDIVGEPPSDDDRAAK